MIGRQISSEYQCFQNQGFQPLNKNGNVCFQHTDMDMSIHEQHNSYIQCIYIDLYVYQLQPVSSSADWWTQLHPAEATGPNSAERTCSFSRKGISPLVEFLQAAAHFKQVLPGYSFCQTTAVEVKVEGFDKLILQLLLFYSKDEKTKRKKQMLCKKVFFFFFFPLAIFMDFFPKISCPKVGRWTWPKWPKPSKKFNTPEV